MKILGYSGRRLVHKEKEMISTEIQMDEKMFEQHRIFLEKNHGFAQSADALVSQVKAALASGPVCKIVTPADDTIFRALFPLLSSEGCSMKIERLKLHRKGFPLIPYRLVTLHKPVRR